MTIPGTIPESLIKADISLGALWTPPLNYAIVSDRAE